MPLSPSTLNQLQSLVREDPTLQTSLLHAKDAAGTAALIARAAQQRGIAVTAAELAEHYETATAAALAPDAALNDAQLDAVAGGAGVVDTVFMSIFTLGIGCAAVSIQRSIESSKGGRPGACHLN